MTKQPQFPDAIAVVAHGQLLAASTSAAWLLGSDTGKGDNKYLIEFLSACKRVSLRGSEPITWLGCDQRMYRLVVMNHVTHGSNQVTIVKFEALDARAPDKADDILAAVSHGLSRRQVEVFALLARGMTDGEIGRELGISYNTARAHVRAIFHKLNVSSRIEAVNAIHGGSEK